MTTKVKLRRKAISGNRQSLYLDFYPPIPHPETGEPTRRDFLGLYLFDNPKNPLDKQHNKEIVQIAEQIKAKWENQLNKPEIYMDFERQQLKMKALSEKDFVDYFKRMADKRKGTSHDNWINTLNFINRFTGGKLRFADLNEQFCEDFKEYLLTTKSIKSETVILAQNTAASYFSKIRAALKQAYRDGYLQKDLNEMIQPIKAAETQRNFLTLEELNRLAQTDCNNPLLKAASLFSALTGLRYSDIQKLLWKEIEYVEGQGYFLRFTQQKTKGTELLPISEQAVTLAGERRRPGDKVFEGLNYSAFYHRYLYQWLGASGITKDVTFHSFRHTYATLQLSQGTDIYTVSKMLGHRNLATTQIYTKVVDKLKRAAADKIKLDLK